MDEAFLQLCIDSADGGGGEDGDDDSDDYEECNADMLSPGKHAHCTKVTQAKVYNQKMRFFQQPPLTRRVRAHNINSTVEFHLITYSRRE